MKWKEKYHGGRGGSERLGGEGEEAIVVGEYWLSAYEVFGEGVSSGP
jgi:hypothetical protein